MSSSKDHVHKYEDYQKKEFERIVRENFKLEKLPAPGKMFTNTNDAGAVLFLAAFYTACIFGLLKLGAWFLGSL